MARYSDIITDDQTLAQIAGVRISVIDSVTGAAATLTTDAGAHLDNPLTTDGFGFYYFNTADGFYELEKRYGGRMIAKDIVLVGTYPGFAITATAIGLAPGSDPTVTVTGDFPAFNFQFGIPSTASPTDSYPPYVVTLAF